MDNDHYHFLKWNNKSFGMFITAESFSLGFRDEISTSSSFPHKGFLGQNHYNQYYFNSIISI